MSSDFAVIIAGLGAMGSAAAFQLARRGVHVLGLDRFTPPHAFGSSHGQTRIIREAYFEHPAYVPLVRRAYELWEELEALAGAKLFHQTGGLMIGRPESTVVTGAKRSAELHHLPHECLSAAEISRRFPALQPPAGMVGVWEPRAGMLFPEEAIAAQVRLARGHGATLRCDEPVLRWSPEGGGVRVVTAKGEYTARRLIISAGSWAPALVPDLELPLTVERQVLFWFEPTMPEMFGPERCPIYLCEHAPGRFFYGFPEAGQGVKIAGHHEGEITEADAVRREVAAAEVAAMRAVFRPFLPALDGPLLQSVVCMYTNTPDGHFLIDAHPRHPQVLLASPCSGHGFKFASAIGEILSELALIGRTRFDLGLFRYRWR